MARPRLHLLVGEDVLLAEEQEPRALRQREVARQAGPETHPVEVVVLEVGRAVAHLCLGRLFVAFLPLRPRNLLGGCLPDRVLVLAALALEGQTGVELDRLVERELLRLLQPTQLVVCLAKVIAVVTLGI